MQFGGQPPSAAVGYPNGFPPDPRRLYVGPPHPHPSYPPPHPYYPPWNGMPVPTSPPGVFRPTVDGWYIPPTPHPPIPPSHPGSDSSYPYSATLASSPSTTNKPILPPDNWVHDFWKGRFAPFPGATSPPSLLRKTTSRGVTITAPRDPQTQTLAPPHSSNIIFETKHSPVKTKVGQINPRRVSHPNWRPGKWQRKKGKTNGNGNGNGK
jgi:hypothetical protein